MRISIGDHTPQVADDAWVAPTAVVIGDVHLGAGASVWYGAVLRGDGATIRIGERSNIQDACVVHVDPGFPATVGAGVSVGHGAVLHGCTVADDVLVGMHATVLNGARVGAGSLVAAGALVAEGAEIPPGSLVAGVPGKIRRELTAAERDHIRANAATYTELLRRHRAARLAES
jgi:carbonic anhydrase/acetyltransferase-like protein (isoleucine patch superfamily)